MNGSGERQRWVEPRVHFEFGPEFLRAFIATFGIEGWNRWISRMISEGYMPLGWSSEEVEPPVWYSFDFGKVDLPRETLERLDLRVCWMGDEDVDDGAEEPGGQPSHREILGCPSVSRSTFRGVWPSSQNQVPVDNVRRDYC